MNKLSVSEWIAVAAAVLLVGYFFILPSASSVGKVGTPAAQDQTSQAGQQPAASTDQSATPAQQASNTSMNTPSLTIKDEVVGTGAVAAVGSNVEVLYTGMLADGTVFDASSKHGNVPLPFQVGAPGLIAGFDQGVRGMKVGGTRLVTIPPELGYGASGIPGVIPANATLQFRIQLVSVK